MAYTVKKLRLLVVLMLGLSSTGLMGTLGAEDLSVKVVPGNVLEKAASPTLLQPADMKQIVPVRITVPSVVGMSLDKAKEVLDSKGLKLGKVTYQENAEVDAGNIISQSPAVNQQATAGAAVDVVVAKAPVPKPAAPKPVALPKPMPPPDLPRPQPHIMPPPQPPKPVILRPSPQPPKPVVPQASQGDVTANPPGGEKTDNQDPQDSVRYSLPNAGGTDFYDYYIPDKPVDSAPVILAGSASVDEEAVTGHTAPQQTAPGKIPRQKDQPATGTPPPVTSSPLDEVDRQLKAMETANIAFNSPQKMNLDEEASIQLLLDLNASIDELKGQLTETGVKEGANVKVSTRMMAHLSGADFTITSSGDETQAVSRTTPTEWRWTVKSKSVGQHRLNLTLTAWIMVAGKETSRTIKTFSKDIDVEVTRRQQAVSFFDENWKWLWASILVPVAGLLWKKWQKKADDGDKQSG